MPKLKIYLDTSVLNFYYADDTPERRDITKELFKEIKEENMISSFLMLLKMKFQKQNLKRGEDF